MGVSDKLSMVTSLPQLSRTQVFRLVGVYIGKPYLHMGDVRFLVEEGLERHNISSAGANSPVNCIHSSGKGICPEEVWGTCILQQGPSFIQNALVCSLSHAVLFCSGVCRTECSNRIPFF